MHCLTEAGEPGPASLRALQRQASLSQITYCVALNRRLGMAAEQDAPLAYFAGTPAGFQADADMLLQLRGGEHLPAHSQLLASTSPVLYDMLKVAASQVPMGGKIVLPIDCWDFSKCEAVDILKARIQRQALSKYVSLWSMQNTVWLPTQNAQCVSHVFLAVLLTYI